MKNTLKILGTIAISVAFMYCLKVIGFCGSCLALIPVMLGIVKIWNIKIDW